MKKINLLTKTKKALQVIAILASSMLFIACNKNNDSSSSSGSTAFNPNAFNLGSCINCQGLNGGSVLVQAQAATGSDSALMTLNLIAISNGVNPYATNFVTSYSGPVALDGALNLMTPDAFSYMCPVQPGQYQVRTVQAGQMSMGILSSLKLQVIGPGGTIIINVGQGSIYGVNSMGGIPRLNLWMALESVNGYPCGSGIVQTY
jgi:hypothetical protein